MRSFSGHCGVPFSFAAIGSDSLSEASLDRQRKLEQLDCLLSYFVSRRRREGTPPEQELHRHFILPAALGLNRMR